MTYPTERNERLAIERLDRVDLTSSNCNKIENFISTSFICA